MKHIKLATICVTLLLTGLTGCGKAAPATKDQLEYRYKAYALCLQYKDNGPSYYGEDCMQKARGLSGGN